jgi:hypothetical protein
VRQHIEIEYDGGDDPITSDLSSEQESKDEVLPKDSASQI